MSKGTLSFMFFSMAIVLVLAIIVLNVADYSLYSYKKKCIASAIDFAVSAAVQENNTELSRQGYSEGVDETTGKISTDNIVIDTEKASAAFFSTLESNAGIRKDQVISKMMIIVINPTYTDINYIITNDSKNISGSVTDPSSMETVINTNSLAFWDAADPDSETVYINGNPKTTEFEKRPCYMVFVKNFEIDGLFKKRTATFIAFKGSHIERRDSGIDD